jgi:hypothetical protein
MVFHEGEKLSEALLQLASLFRVVVYIEIAVHLNNNIPTSEMAL